MPYDGGYCPQGLTFEQRTEMLDKDPDGFRVLVDKTLQHHYEMICKFHERGTYFFDYGNSFLKAVYDSGVKSICKNGENDLDGFIFPPTSKISLVPACSTSATARSVGAA